MCGAKHLDMLILVFVVLPQMLWVMSAIVSFNLFWAPPAMPCNPHGALLAEWA